MIEWSEIDRGSGLGWELIRFEWREKGCWSRFHEALRLTKASGLRETGPCGRFHEALAQGPVSRSPCINYKEWLVHWCSGAAVLPIGAPRTHILRPMVR